MHEHAHAHVREQQLPVHGEGLVLALDGPQHDEIRGAQDWYGDIYEPNENAVGAEPLGLIATGTTVFLGGVPAPTVSNGATLSINEDNTSPFANDEDWFEIALADDETYTIDLKGQDSGSGTLPDPYLILYDADGNWVADNDDSGSLDSQLVYTPEVSGTYFIVAREVGAGTGTYALSVGAEEAPQVEDSLLMV